MSSAIVFLRILVPRIPLILRTIIAQLLGSTPESSKWDLPTAVIITVLRNIIENPSSTVSRVQTLTKHVPEPKGQIWVANVTLPSGDAPSEDNDTLRQLLFRAVDDMLEPTQKEKQRLKGCRLYDEPDLISVEAEWTGHRSGVSQSEPLPSNLTQTEKHHRLCKETTSLTTMLYVHGGAFYLMDPATHRPVVAKLCRLSGAKALSVRYRLAPQHAFPAALMDCLVAYMNLLYPAERSEHVAEKPENIIFAGDSAGAGLCFSLLQLLLHWNRTYSGRKETLHFNDHHISLPIPLPRGIAAFSPYLDLTRSMPSLWTNAHYDYLPAPNAAMHPSETSPAMSPSAMMPHDSNTAQNSLPAANGTPSPALAAAPQRSTAQPSRMNLKLRDHYIGETVNPSPCELWPQIPPRADIYCVGELLAHPLVSPLIVEPKDWAGAPPVFAICGEEMLADEILETTGRVARGGTEGVRLEQYEAMPHTFAMVLDYPFSRVNSKAFYAWAGWMRDLASSRTKAGAVFLSAPILEERQLVGDAKELRGSLDSGEVNGRMRRERDRRCRVYEELLEESRKVGAESRKKR